MPAFARKDIVVAGAVGFYHCICRCVRRAFLCGDDPVSGRNFDHRKEWVKARVALLAEVFAIEVCNYAVMSNHVHLLLRTRPDVAATWSPEEVARRWLMLKKTPPTDQQIAMLAADAGRVEVLRRQLADLSWFMRMLNEHIAKRANKEDGVTGHFWEGRFKSQMLEDEAAVVACAAYIDLNPIRAGIAGTLEDSDFTSAQQRIDERREESDSNPSPREDAAKPRGRIPLCPIDERDGGFLPLATDRYLSLLDYAGRLNRPGKHGKIPADLSPVLERLGIEPQGVATLGRRFPKQVKVALQE